MRKNNKYNIYLKKNDKISVNFKNQIYTFEIEELKYNLFQIVEEIKILKNDEVNIVLSLDFFKIEKNKKGIYEKISKDIYLILDEELLKILKFSFKNQRIKIYSFYNLLKYIYQSEEILDNNILIEKEKSYEIKFSSNKILELEITEDSFNNEYDFNEYNLIFDYSEKLNFFLKINDFSKLENLNRFRLNEKTFFLIILIILFILSNKYISYIFDTENIENEISNKILEIDDMNNKISDLEDNLKEIKEKENIFNDIEIKKFPFYKDIEFFLELRKYDLEYQSIEYEKNYWKLNINIANIDDIKLIKNEFLKRYKNVKLEKISETENRINIEYWLGIDYE